MIQLSLPGQDTSWSEVNPNAVDVKTLILYPFFVEADANGNSFDIKKEDVQAIHDVYNKSVKFKWSKLQKLGKNVPLKHVETVANLLDHDPKSLNVVGRVIGELEIIEKGGDPYLFATLRVKGKENVERVKDGRFSQVSIGFDPVNHELQEISWVVNGAIPGAQAIMSGLPKTTLNNIPKSTDFNLMNVTNLKSVLLSQYDKQRNRLDDIQNEIEIETMLISLAADGKLYPRDKLRIKSQLSKISDKQIRLDTFNLLSENLRTVVDFGIKARNKMSVNWEENLMSKSGRIDMIDLQKIAAKSAMALKKGHKVKMGEDDEEESQMGKKKKFSDHEEEYKESEEHLSKKKKAKMGEDYEKHEFKKKDLKHCLSLSEDKEELGKYLSTFLSKEEEGEEESDEEIEKEEEKEKGKFSKEIKKLKSEYVELKKQNADVLEKLAILSKGTEESRALFNKIVDLQTTSK